MIRSTLRARDARDNPQTLDYNFEMPFQHLFSSNRPAIALSYFPVILECERPPPRLIAARPSAPPSPLCMAGESAKSLLHSTRGRRPCRRKAQGRR